MKNCPDCRNHNDDDNIYCTTCGRPLDATDDRTFVMNAPAPTCPTTPSSPSTPASPTSAATHALRATATPPQRAATAATFAPVRNTRITSVQRERLLALVDISTSMGGQLDPGVIKLDAAARATRNLVAGKAQSDPDDEVGIIKFNHLAVTACFPHPIRTHKAQLLQAIQDLRSSGGTDIARALATADDKLGRCRAGAVGRLVILSDGHHNDEPDQEDPVEIARRLKARGVVIDVIGIGRRPSDVDEPRLRRIASSSGGESCYRFINDHRTLIAHYTQLSNKTQIR